LYGKGKLDEAIVCYRQAIALDPKSAQPHNNLGVALQAKGKLDEAIVCYRRAIALDPRYAGVYLNLGIALEAKRKVDEAIACYRRAIALDPKVAVAHLNLGLALQAKGKLDEAIVCFRQAIALDPKVAVAHLNLGAALHDKGKEDEASECFQRAIDIDPGLAQAHTGLGQALLLLGRFSAAQKSLRRSLMLLRANHPLRLPVSRLVGQCQQGIDIDGKLKSFLAGKGAPGEAVTQLQMADLARAPFNQLNLTSARLYRDAFARQPQLTTAHRFNAARCAALAGCGQGKDASQLASGVRLVWRKQALVWLQADLAAWRRQLKSEVPGQSAQARKAVEGWLRNPDLAGVREPNQLARLPAAEWEGWLRLWTQAARALQPAD
jgi:tetratricopeptide (TPR) repeat protein